MVVKNDEGIEQFAEDVLNMASGRGLSPDEVVTVFAGVIGSLAKMMDDTPKTVADAVKVIKTEAGDE